MILPNVRMSFGRPEAAWLLRRLERAGARDRERLRARLGERGLDAIIDDPRTLECVLDPGRPADDVPPRLALYVLVRHAMLEGGIRSRTLADYLTAMVYEFGRSDRARRIASDDEAAYRYLVDILEDLSRSGGRRAFLLRVHLGNFALWLSGLFPDFIVSRVHRKGGPDLEYYEAVGRTGYRLAARDPRARRGSLHLVYEEAASAFGHARIALNRFSDRHLFPRAASPVDRLLRQVSDGFRPMDAT
ncbi:MAG: hypothetical protein ACE5HF_06070 [Gemmatimonadota bacterium]